MFFLYGLNQPLLVLNILFDSQTLVRGIKFLLLCSLPSKLPIIKGRYHEAALPKTMTVVCVYILFAP